jgi:hypothetical protein
VGCLKMNLTELIAREPIGVFLVLLLLTVIFFLVVNHFVMRDGH